MAQKSIYSQVRGVGYYLPEKIISNAQLQDKLDTSDEWIQKRTGIKQRHIAACLLYTSPSPRDAQ